MNWPFKLTYTRAIGGEAAVIVLADSASKALTVAKDMRFTGRDFRDAGLSTLEAYKAQQKTQKQKPKLFATNWRDPQNGTYECEIREGAEDGPCVGNAYQVDGEESLGWLANGQPIPKGMVQGW